MTRSPLHPSRTGSLHGAVWLVMLMAACSDPAPTPGDIPPDSASPADPAWEADSVRTPVQWTVTELAAPRGFRAHGWGAGDTLWGIGRGRLAMASLSGDSLTTTTIVWGAGTAPGHDLAWWTGPDGLFARRTGRVERITAAVPPTAEHLGPEVLWSPDGERALLTWTAEAGAVHTVIEADGQRVLQARISGYQLGAGALWLDATRVILTATANGPRTGPALHREEGYRSDLAVVDVTTGAAALVTDAADGDFLVPEGLLHPDTLLVGVRRRGALPVAHMTLDTRTWTLTPRLDHPGRAAAAHGLIALLESVAGPGEPAYRLFLVSRDGASGPLAAVQGHEVRLLWHPRRALLSIAVESETPGGMRTLIVR